MAVYFDKSRNAWVADYSVIRNDQRVRKRKYFLAKSEATACFARQKAQKRKYGEASEFDLEDYQRLKAIEQRLQGVPLEEAVRHYMSIGKLRESPKLNQAIEEYLLQKECSKEHLVNLRIYLQKMLDNLGDVRVATIQARDIHFVLRNLDYSMVYKNNMRRAFVTFFNYCIFNDYATSNEAERVPLFKEERGDVECIAIQDAKKLFEVLESDYPHLVAFNALRAFAGIRTAHAKTMSWSQINFEERGIRFSGGGKRVTSYLEGYPDNLWLWLEKYRGQEISEAFSRETGRVTQKHKINIPHNGMRHGFATYHLAKYRDINSTSLLLMHRGNPRMLFDRYRGVTSACDADEYFSILPQ